MLSDTLPQHSLPSGPIPKTARCLSKALVFFHSLGHSSAGTWGSNTPPWCTTTGWQSLNHSLADLNVGNPAEILMTNRLVWYLMKENEYCASSTAREEKKNPRSSCKRTCGIRKIMLYENEMTTFFQTLLRNIFKAWGFSTAHCMRNGFSLCNYSNLSSGSGTVFLDYWGGMVGDSDRRCSISVLLSDWNH